MYPIHGGWLRVVRFRRFILGPFGATTAAYFRLLWFVLRYLFRTRNPWSFAAVACSLELWFAIDSAASVLHGAVFNVLLVNVPCLLALGIPLRALRSEFQPPPHAVAPEPLSAGD